MAPICRPKRAGSWASPATCSAAPATCSGSSACPSCSRTVASAASRRPRWRRASSTLEPSWRCVDENWGGSLKSKLLSGATSPRCSKVFRSSTSEAPILSSSFWTITGTWPRSSASSSGTPTAWRSS